MTDGRLPSINGKRLLLAGKSRMQSQNPKPAVQNIQGQLSGAAQEYVLLATAGRSAFHNSSH